MTNVKKIKKNEEYTRILIVSIKSKISFAHLRGSLLKMKVQIQVKVKVYVKFNIKFEIKVRIQVKLKIKFMIKVKFVVKIKVKVNIKTRPEVYSCARVSTLPLSESVITKMAIVPFS